MPEPTPRPPAAPPGKAASDTFTQASVDTREPAPLGPGGPPFPFLGPPAAPGDLGTLGGYRVVKLLGEGGMGFVFRAEDDQLRRPVALKVMRPEVAAGPVAKDRFLREGRAAAGLKSDHVVTIYQVGEANGVPFLAMEYLDGSALDDWLKARPGPASVAAVVKVARDVLKGLAAAHEKGLVHRDIKPANLWVEAGANRVKLLDFGLTRDAAGADQFTKEGAIVGTPAYMAPEQANGQPVDGRADLFSVGVVLYRMLAGKSPFQRDTLFATIAALATETPPGVETLVGGVPGEVGWFVNRLLAKDPAGRPADARAALAELQAVERAVRAAAAAAPLVSTPEAVAVPDPWADLAAAVPEATAVEDGPADRVVTDPGSVPHPARPRGGLPKPLLLAGGAVAAAAVIAVVAFVLTRGKPPEPTPADVAEATKPARPPAKATPKATAKEPADPVRRAAELLRAGGAAVRTSRGDIAPDRPLPADPFTVIGVWSLGGFKLAPDFVPAHLLPALTDLPSLDYITVEDAACTPAELGRLANMPLAAGLQRLRLGFELTPQTLDTLKRFPRLAHLGCWAESAGDETLTRLGELPPRVWLLYPKNLGRSGRVTETGWAALAARPFQTLELGGSEIGLPTARLLAGNRALTELHLSRGLSDQVVAEVAKSQSLKRLYLSEGAGGELTDNGLLKLAACPTLQMVHMHPAPKGVTEAGVKALSAALPGCAVGWNGKGWKAGTPAGAAPPPAADGAPPPAVAPFDAAAARRHQEAWAAHFGQKVVEPNAIGMNMVLVPPGEFRMGATPEEPGAVADEQPRHTVRLTRPFRIGKHEVTVAEFRAFADATGYKTEAETGGGAEAPAGGANVRDPKLTWRTPRYPVSDRLPVASISRPDAEAFCAWLSKKEGKAYRLPTEAEWEYACRAGTDTVYYTGETITPAQANFTGAGGKPTEVGRFPANGFGLHDMIGNVYELCGDGRRTYTADPVDDPVGPRDSGVMRGGGWTGGGNLAWFRSSKRFLKSRPVYYSHGFRVACEAGREIDLLALADPAKDAISGTWEMKEGELVGTGAGIKFEFPYRPPAEYDFAVEFTTTSGSARQTSLTVTRDGRPLAWLMHRDDALFGFGRVDGKLVTEKRPDLALRFGQRYTARVAVRRDRVTGYFDGREVATVAAPDSAVFSADASRLRDDFLLGLILGGSDRAVNVHRATVTEVTGTGTRTRPAAFPPLDPAWVGKVRAMPPADQAKELAAELRRRNPGFDDEVAVTRAADGVDVRFPALTVADITPVAALPRVNSLTATGVGHHEGEFRRGRLRDLAPLRGMDLFALVAHATEVSDLGPLAGHARLDTLVLGATRVADLAPLGRLKALKHLDLWDCTGVTDVGPLAGCESLVYLTLTQTAVADLRPLAKLPLAHLRVERIPARDYAALAGLPLESLMFDPVEQPGCAAVARRIATLRTINNKPAAEFWKTFDAMKPAAFPSLDPAWVAKVRAMKRDDQVKEVGEELKRRNPGFDGQFTRVLDNPVKGIGIVHPAVADLTPLRAWADLEQVFLDFPLERRADCLLADLRPLAGMRLRIVKLGCCPRLTDLEPLRGMPLTYLQLIHTGVTSLDPVRDAPLTSLGLIDTPVTDLSPVAGKKLREFGAHEQGRLDLDYRILKGMPVRAVGVDPKACDEEEWAVLRSLPLDKIYIGNSYDVKRDEARLRALLAAVPTVATIESSVATSTQTAKRQSIAGLIRDFPNIKTVNNKPVAEYWKALDAMKP